jgi:hypothetical protein
VIDAQERALVQQRFANDRADYRSMKTFARTHHDRVWAVEGARGVGTGLAQQPVAEDDPVLAVPARLSARVRALGERQRSQDRQHTIETYCYRTIVSYLSLSASACLLHRIDRGTSPIVRHCGLFSSGVCDGDEARVRVDASGLIAIDPKPCRLDLNAAYKHHTLPFHPGDSSHIDDTRRVSSH